MAQNKKFSIHFKEILEIFGMNTYRFRKYFDEILGKLHENFEEIEEKILNELRRNLQNILKKYRKYLAET